MYFRVTVVLFVMLVLAGLTNGNDFKLLGIFPLNNKAPAEEREVPNVAVIYFEAFRFAIGKINNDSTMLFGNQLTQVVGDCCYDPPIELLRKASLWQGCAGVIGPATTEDAKTIAPVLNLYSMPIVSYMAYGQELEHRELYPNFFRTIPSVRNEIKAVLSVCIEMEWSYVGMIHSEDPRSRSIYTSMIRLIDGSDLPVCIVHSIPFTNHNNSTEEMLNNLAKDDKLKVIILALSENDFPEFVNAATNSNLQNRFIFLTTTVWMDDSLVADDQSFNLILLRHKLNWNLQREFTDYFVQLRPEGVNSSDFSHFWEIVFHCSLTSGNKTLKRPCDENDSLREFYYNLMGLPTSFVIKAVNAMACALRADILEQCPADFNRDACIQANFFSSSSFNKNMWENIRYQLQWGDRSCPINFRSGDDLYKGVVPYYHIMSVAHSNSSVKEEEIGHWNMLNGMDLKGDDLGFIELNNKSKNIFRSIPNQISSCSSDCIPGYLAVRTSLSLRCRHCWECQPCPSVTMVTVNNTCVGCSFLTKPDESRTRCEHLPWITTEMDSLLSIVLLCISGLNILLAFILTIIIVKYRNTKLITESRFELLLIILAGLFITFALPLTILLPPNNVICGIQRVLSGFAFTLFYAPLLLRSIDLKRYYEYTKDSRGSSYVYNATSNCFIVIGIILMQVLLSLVWLVNEENTMSFNLAKNADDVMVSCLLSNASFALSLVPNLLFISLCAYYAIRTRKFSHNCYESRSIGGTMYLTFILYVIYVTAYYFSPSHDLNFTRDIIRAVFILIIGMVTMFGVFSNRVYTLLSTYIDDYHVTNVLVNQNISPSNSLKS